MMVERLSSISAVVVLRRASVDPVLLSALSERLAEVADDSEIIVVANGVDNVDVVTLKRQITDIPDCACYVLGETVDPDAAAVVGLEAAVGDYAMLLHVGDGAAGRSGMAALPAAILALQGGYDIVVALPRLRAGARPGVFERAAYAVLSMLMGLSITSSRTAWMILSRDAVLQILSKPNAELLLKARNAGPGFPVRTIDDAYDEPAETETRPVIQRAAKALRLLVSVGAAPVRVVSVVALASGVLSVLYSIYVVVIYLLRPDVAAGWTTLSLQVAGMMFLFSIMLALLSEYIIQIHAATSGRRRALTVRELRSEKSRNANRLNVVDAQGAYKLGAPSERPDPAPAA